MASLMLPQDKTKGIKFPVQGSHVHQFSTTLYDHLVSFPSEVIPIFDRELWKISTEVMDCEPEELDKCQCQIFGLLDKDTRVMRCMNPTDIERLITVKGIVIRCSDLTPDMNAAVFRCTTEDCKHEVKVMLTHWTIDEPTKCELCGASHSFQIIHNDCKFTDRQVLKLQESTGGGASRETPELVPDGETPQNVAIVVFDDLVNQVRPGDRVQVTGIYRAAPATR
eukprot:s1249_g7.t1